MSAVDATSLVVGLALLVVMWRSLKSQRQAQLDAMQRAGEQADRALAFRAPARSGIWRSGEGPVPEDE